MAAEPSLAALIEELASTAVRRVLATCVEVAARLHMPIYLVGGAVRDVLLTGRMPDLDLDISCEGHALELAQEVALELGGDLRSHPRFLTAEVFLEGTRIDFVTTRSERYEEPAGLPLVSPADLEADLARRDFTLNAMALPLWPAGSGELIDPFAGRADFESRQLRVLYEESFFDDPTRILRGVRLGARLSLRFESHTAALAMAALQAQAFAPLSADRLRHELVLLLEDQQVEKSLRQLETLGFLPVLGRTAEFHDSDWQRLSRVLECRSRWDNVDSRLGSPRWWLVYLMSLGQDEEPSNRSLMAQRLGLDEHLTAILTDYPQRLSQIRSELGSADLAPHEACRRLDRLHPEELALLVASAEGNIAIWIDRWLHELRDTRLTIDGTDLKRAGFAESPAMGRALRATLEARLDGTIEARQELEFAVRQMRLGNG